MTAHHTRRGVAALATIGLVIAATGASAQPSPYTPLDLPLVRSVGKTVGTGAVLVRCWRIANGETRARASCIVTETEIRMSDASRVDQLVTEATADPAAAKTYAEIYCGGVFGMTLFPADLDASDRAVVDSAMRSCGGAPLTTVRAFAAAMHQIYARSCGVVTYTWPEPIVFERVDQNTWVRSSGPEGTCNVSHVDTLWRAGQVESWNFKTVDVTPESAAAKAPTCKGGTITNEWRADAGPKRMSGCRYVSL